MPRPLFQPIVLNGPQGDPVVYVDFLFSRRALLFDLGNIRALAPRKVLRLTDVFVSHTHMDHFTDFAWLLRLLLVRDIEIRLFGPPGFIRHVECHLAAFEWNLAHKYEEDVHLTVTELHADERGRRAEFRFRHRFARENDRAVDLPGNVLLDDGRITVTAALLDHQGLPSMAWSVEEGRHVNIWRNRLDELGLGTGPWLSRLRQAVLDGRPDDEVIVAEWRRDGRLERQEWRLGDLRREVLRVTAGQKIAYVVDCGFSGENRARASSLLAGAHTAFVEAAFLHEDADRAEERGHLTARQAGWLAREAGVERLVPLHFSPRYGERVGQLETEALAAFRGDEGSGLVSARQ
ncbi:MAG: ribonuclease Z [Guyparkeria sp.]|uniref:ribonuclease Z n=1 Tax=Guyparkeria sp. TaxID=2035736 RepID=UPI00397AA116